MILATDIDPTPWGAWVALAVGVLTLVGLIFGAIFALWKGVARNDLRNVVREELDRRDAELDERIETLSRDTDASFRYVHGRIDDVILGRQARPAP
ncbi:hypothetical protein [EBPR siphovirus 6]|nr:hypothetical protein [EBPR siphovirus 6]